MDLASLSLGAESEILAALSALEADYQKNGKQWRCPSNPIDPKIRGSGNVIASEALLCFLLPLSAMRSQGEFQEKVFEIISENSLRERLESHLLSHKERADFTGHPYILVVDADQVQHPFIDSYCFIVSILILYAELFGKPKSKATLDEFKSLFRICLEGLVKAAVKVESGRYAGFFVTDTHLPEAPFKYPTWMAVDTLSDLQSVDIATFPFTTPESTQHITALRDTVLHDVLLEYTRIYIDGHLTEAEKDRIKGRNVDLTKDIVREDETDNSAHYNLWATIVLLHLQYVDSEKLAAAFKVLMPYVEDNKRLFNVQNVPCRLDFFSRHFPSEGAIQNVMTDRCFLPQYVKGLSILLRKLPRLRDEEAFQGSLEKSLEALLKNRKKDCALWDKFAERDASYAIYQTERAIEALCALINLRAALTTEAALAPSLRTQHLGGDLIKAVLEHAIVIQVGGEDARKLISREVGKEVAKLRGDLLDIIEQFIAAVERAAAPDKGKEAGGGDVLSFLKDEVIRAATAAGMRPKKK